jgi:hypothetical protein
MSLHNRTARLKTRAFAQQRGNNMAVVRIQGTVKDQKVIHDLPAFCMKCGAATSDRQQKVFRYHHRGLLLVLPALFGSALLAAIFTPVSAQYKTPVVIFFLPFFLALRGKHMTVACPVCPAHRSHWSSRNTLIAIGSIPVFVLGFIGMGFICGRVIEAFATPGHWSAARIDAGMVAMVVSMVAGIYASLTLYILVKSESIYPIEITADSIVLSGVAPSFANAIENPTIVHRAAETSSAEVQQAPLSKAHFPKPPSLPSEARFPKPPFRIDQSLVDSPPADQVISSYLEQITSWRTAVLEFLAGLTPVPAHAEDGLSPRARAALSTFLQSSWEDRTTMAATNSPYNINAFPLKALESTSDVPVVLLMKALCWRAGFLDYLSDVWDVGGEPELDIFECEALALFLIPLDSDGMCVFCLSQCEADSAPIGQHKCLAILIGHVRAKWPPF